MKSMWPVVALVCFGCSFAGQGPAVPRGQTEIDVESRHDRDVDVYALCGRHDIVHVGNVPAGSIRSFTVPSESLVCATGFRFVMIPTGHPSGYLTRPVARIARRHIDLWIEKYPGLSDWRVR